MPTPTSPTFVYARADLSALTITPYTVDEDGTWSTSYTGPTSFLGYIESCQLSATQGLLREKSIDSPFENFIAAYSGFELTIVEKLKRVAGATAGPVIPKIVATHSYAKVVLQFGTGVGKIGTWTMYGTWQSAPVTMSNEGNVLTGIMLKQADISYGASGLVPLSYVES